MSQLINSGEMNILKLKWIDILFKINYITKMIKWISHKNCFSKKKKLAIKAIEKEMWAEFIWKKKSKYKYSSINI